LYWGADPSTDVRRSDVAELAVNGVDHKKLSILDSSCLSLLRVIAGNLVISGGWTGIRYNNTLH
jgi:hypothetical protein